MTFFPVPNVAQLAIKGLIDGQETVNTLYFYNADGVSPLTLTALSGLVDPWVRTTWTDPVAGAWALQETVYTDMSSESGAQIINPGSGVVGGFADQPAPNNVSLCVSFKTLNRGRSSRGRNYLPGIPKYAISGISRFKPEYLTLVQTSYEALLTLLAENAWQWVVVSRYHNLEPRPSGTVTFVSSVVISDDVVDSQRRRLPGRGA